jgi:hypothetical protein
MAVINVIPAQSTYAVAVPGTKGHAAEVKMFDAAGDRLVGTVTPFPGYEGALSVTMGDFNAIPAARRCAADRRCICTA